MQFGWVKWGFAASAAVLALLAGPVLLQAADDVTAVAEQLDKRTKPPETSEGSSPGLSDSAVRVLMTYAFSILPQEAPGPDGKMAKVDKADANKFLIPTEDARRVIRAATRSAYAETCNLLDLQRANYQTFMRHEEARKTWTREQMLMIDALHMFSASYFAGTITITAKEEPGDGKAAPAEGNTAAQAAGAPKVLSPKKPECPPEQKQKVENAITAYVNAAKAEAPAQEGAPSAPVAGGAD